MSLLSCPFCGGEPKKEEQMDEDIWSHNTVPWRRVGCDQCEIWTNWTCEGSDPSETEAWNRRATPSPGKADAEDAARYRWLREHASPQWRNGPGLYWYLPRYMTGTDGEKLDTVLDAAIKSDKQ